MSASMMSDVVFLGENKLKASQPHPIVFFVRSNTGCLNRELPRNNLVLRQNYFILRHFVYNSAVYNNISIYHISYIIKDGKWYNEKIYYIYNI